MTTPVTADVQDAITFEPPGPGSWFLLADHFPDPVTPQYADIWIPTMSAANATLAERYGIPLAGIDGVSLHGYLYLRGVPLVGSNAKTLPPMWALKVGVALHPKLRRCRRAADQAMRDRPWRAVAEDWERRVRPTWVEANLARQRIDPSACTDDELAAHVVDCTRAWRDGYAIHFDYHGSDQLPIAAYVVRGEQLGLRREDLLAALTGWSPASLGRDAALAELRSAVCEAVGDDTEQLASATTLDAIRELASEVADALDAYLELHGWRMVTSYDLEGRALVELPAVIIGHIRAEEPVADPVAIRRASDLVADRLRAAVPADDRDELDRLLDDARVTYGLRDDNGAVVGAWPVGLTRRAYLEAGDRLRRSGALEQPEHVFELLADEVTALLRSGDGAAVPVGLDRAAIAVRARRRRQAAAAAAPLVIGPPMVAPDASVLPTAMALLTQAQVLIAEDSGFVDAERVAVDDGSVVGTGIGRGVVHGVARVATDAEAALAEVQPGEVLVARSTNPAWNAVLPLVAALVVEEGGALSHAGIMARELDLATIIGAVGATSTLQTGDLVVVDVAAGTVRRAVAAPSTIGT